MWRQTTPWWSKASDTAFTPWLVCSGLQLCTYGMTPILQVKTRVLTALLQRWPRMLLLQMKAPLQLTQALPSRRMKW